VSRRASQRGPPAAGSVTQASDASIVTVSAPLELGEQLAGPLEPKAERAAETKIVGERWIEAAHATPPGHGRARARSAGSYTFA
jgi:hypothetical protein